MQPRKFLEALEAVVYVALHSGEQAVNSKEIAEHQGVQPRYLEQIMQMLVKSGILRGSRGPRGGYTLARERRRQTVGELYQLIMELDAKKESKQRNSKLFNSILLPMWQETERNTIAQLDEVTIETLCKRTGAMNQITKKTDFII
jgi:Rrf2 family protein